MMSELWQRLQREAKANGKKAGLLAGLLLFGCCFWFPMLARAVVPKRAVAAASPATGHAAAPTPSSVPAKPAENAATATDTDQGKFWSNLAQSLADDPMFQSAGVDSLSRDPFQVAETPEPLPVLFVEEPKPKIEIKSVKEQRTLELNSTVISRTRRAALINGQLYQLGRPIQANGRNYRVTQIESHRVVLSSGEQTIELTLARPQLNDVLDRGESIDPPSQ